MADARLRVFYDNEAASQAQLDQLGEIRVEQAIGMAAEAELEVQIGLDDNGYWSGIEEDYAQPEARVRVEVKAGEEFVPLIDGPIVGHSLELSASPDDSRLVLVVQDDSVLLNRDERVALFEEKTEDEIARELFEAQGLDAEVDSVPAASGGVPRVVVQRGSAMNLLRELGRRHGMFVYVEPTDSPGRSRGVFKRPDLGDSDLPEILIMGRDRNVNRLSIRFDALRPMTAKAGGVNVTDQELLLSSAAGAGVQALGEVDAATLVTPGEMLLARTREEDADLEAAVVAAVDHASWAYSASGEVESEIYPAVLSPYRVVRVAGAGGYLSGSYLISRVGHTLSSDGYRQQFTLRRNARSAGSGAAGALAAGVF